MFFLSLFFKCTCDLAEYPGKSQTAWANALLGRIFWDFLREKRWADAVSHKIQKKLSKIRVRAVVKAAESERLTIITPHFCPPVILNHAIFSTAALLYE